MKFSEYTPKADAQGTMRVCDDQVILCVDENPCIMCGQPTRFVEICSEARFCSDECVNRFYERMAENEEARSAEDD